MDSSLQYAETRVKGEVTRSCKAHIFRARITGSVTRRAPSRAAITTAHELANLVGPNRLGARERIAGARYPRQNSGEGRKRTQPHGEASLLHCL